MIDYLALNSDGGPEGYGFSEALRGLNCKIRKPGASCSSDPLGGLMPAGAPARWRLICVLLILCGRHLALAQGGYNITDLGIGNQWYSEAHGLNNGGWAVGEYEPVGALYQHAFLYDGQTTAALPIVPNVYSIAWSINDSNVVVGEYVADPNPLFFIIQAFKYSNGVVTGLGFLSSTSYSSAHA